VYVKGVGLGRGLSAVTSPSGVCIVLGSGFRVEVANGIRSTTGEDGRACCGAQAAKRKSGKVSRKKLKDMWYMRRLLLHQHTNTGGSMEYRHLGRTGI